MQLSDLLRVLILLTGTGLPEQEHFWLYYYFTGIRA